MAASRKPSPLATSGFTLIEVLIAFSICAIVLGVTFGTITSSLHQEREADRSTIRLLEARSILDEVAADPELGEGTLNGTLITGDAWRVDVSIVDGDLEDSPFVLFRLEFVASEGARERLRLSKLVPGVIAR